MKKLMYEICMKYILNNLQIKYIIKLDKFTKNEKNKLNLQLSLNIL